MNKLEIAGYVVAAMWGALVVWFMTTSVVHILIWIPCFLSFGIATTIYQSVTGQLEGENPVTIVLADSLLSILLGIPVFFLLSSFL
tara:strand:- start:259 stop:516 length:258 start_codon:yes stop_codon:yes gene_type:complete